MKGPINVSHSEFVKMNERGQVLYVIRKSVAGSYISSHPSFTSGERGILWIWNLFGFVCLFGGPFSIIWIKWYWGVGMFVIGVIFGQHKQNSETDLVYRAAIRNETLYNDLISHGDLQIYMRQN